MKGFWAAVMVAFLLATAAFGEEMSNVSFEEMDRQLNRAGSQVNAQAIFDSIVKGESAFSPEEIVSFLIGEIKKRAGLAAGFLKRSAFLSLIAAFVSRLIPDARTGKYANFIVHLAGALTVYGGTISFMKDAGRAMGVLSDLIESATPILVGLIALTGDTHFSAFVTPIGAFVSGTIHVLLQKGGMSLLNLYAALVLANSIGDMPLTRLLSGVQSALKWMIASAMSLFLLLMATGGVIAGAYDGAFQKGLKYAADSLIPIVGSEIAGRMDSLTAGVQLLKSAAGVTGIIALFSVCLRPAIDAFLCLWGLRLIACVAEPVSDSGTVSILEGFSKVFSLIFALIAAGVTMGILFLSAAIGIGRRVLG